MYVYAYVYVCIYTFMCVCWCVYFYMYNIHMTYITYYPLTQAISQICSAFPVRLHT